MRSFERKWQIGRQALIAAALFAGLSAAQGAVIRSNDFSIGMGYTWPGQWGFSETENTNVGPGSSFDLAISAGQMGAYTTGGVVFSDRELSDYMANGYLATADSSFSISASYTGALPPDAAETSDYRITLVITKISVYASPAYANSTDTIQWNETTIGNAGSSSPIAINIDSPETPYNDKTSFQKILWTPGSFESDGLTQLRSFKTSESAPYKYAIDGFEVEGYILLEYQSISEPGSVALLGAGLLGLGFIRKRQ